MRRGVVIRMVINDLTFDVPPKTHASAVRDRLITFMAVTARPSLTRPKPWPHVDLHWWSS